MAVFATALTVRESEHPGLGRSNTDTAPVWTEFGAFSRVTAMDRHMHSPVWSILMNEVYTLQRRALSPEPRKQPEMPAGPVYVLGKPEVGLSLVIVGEHGVVQTGVVRRFERSEEELVVQTDNSEYRLRVAA